MSTPTACIQQPTTCEAQMKLLTPGGYDRFPAWSPNGTKLAFTASDLPGGASVIALLNPDGSGYVSFSGTKTSDLSPAWSPDGKKIAFLSYAEGDYDLWLMDSDGLGVTQITRSAATDGAPTWSPDGGYIVFASDRGDKQHFNLYLLSANCIAVGSCEDNLVRLTNQPTDDLDPALTP
jgi:TolB protein